MADVWLFERAEHAPDPGQFQAARQLDSGAACGRFVDGLGVRAVVGQVRAWPYTVPVWCWVRLVPWVICVVELDS